MTSTKKIRYAAIIAKEITELKEILSCYKHFEASYEGQTNPVAKAQVQLNKITIRKAISELEAEYAEFVGAARVAGKEQPVSNSFQFVNHVPTALEDAAIMAFNSDRRYTITE